MQSKNEVLTIVGVIAVALFLVTAGWVSRRPGEGTRGIAVAVNESSRRSVQRQPVQDQLWARDNGKSDVVASPPSAYRLPLIPESRRIWHKSTEGIESWGFVTERDAQEVGVSVLDHYSKLDGWELARAETLGLWASSWGCTVYRVQSKEVVMVTALPSRLGERPGGAVNPTRVSMVRVAGEEALRDVFGEARQLGR